MTRSRVHLDTDSTRHGWPAGQDDDVSNSPVIVLTYPYAGGERLQALLSTCSDFACTSGTGVLPLCEQAEAVWQAVDGRSGGPPSRLAETTTRTLAKTMLAALIVRQGRRRWCEVATPAPDAAAAFARLFPQARFICLHRACPDFIQAAVKAGPWGLAGGEFAPFVSAHPASTAAALTAYWTARAGALLVFEQAHREQCYRLRHDDLAADEPIAGLARFLGLSNLDSGPSDALHQETSAAVRQVGPAEVFPTGQIPALLVERANGLMRELGYPPLGADLAVNQ